jgi:Family of unknown function (DUF6348)
MTLSTPPAGQGTAQGATGEILARVLSEAGFDARASREEVLLPSGLRLRAALLENRPLADGRVASASRIVAFHDRLFPEGLPELQHAVGANAELACAAALAAWSQRVLPALEDAVRPKVRDCALLAVKFPARGDGAPRVHQVLLGPVMRTGSAPGETAEEDEPCPACMLTRMQDALRERVRAEGYTGIGLMAGRDAAGNLIADCRVNGERFAEGVARLIAYAQSWTERGVEFREQYVIMRPAPAVMR